MESLKNRVEEKAVEVYLKAKNSSKTYEELEKGLQRKRREAGWNNEPVEVLIYDMALKKLEDELKKLSIKHESCG